MRMSMLTTDQKGLRASLITRDILYSEQVHCARHAANDRWSAQQPCEKRAVITLIGKERHTLLKLQKAPDHKKRWWQRWQSWSHSSNLLSQGLCKETLRPDIKPASYHMPQRKGLTHLSSKAGGRLPKWQRDFCHLEQHSKFFKISYKEILSLKLYFA